MATGLESTTRGGVSIVRGSSATNRFTLNNKSKTPLLECKDNRAILYHRPPLFLVLPSCDSLSLGCVAGRPVRPMLGILGVVHHYHHPAQ